MEQTDMEHVNAPGAPEGSVEQLLLALHERMRVTFFARLAAEQLTPPQFLILRLLDEPRPMSALCQDLFCDASNLTGMADRLGERGLVERRPDPRDRRVRLLALTAKGRRVRARLERGMLPDLPGLRALGDDDRAELGRLLAAVLAHPGGSAATASAPPGTAAAPPAGERRTRLEKRTIVPKGSRNAPSRTP